MAQGGGATNGSTTRCTNIGAQMCGGREETLRGREGLETRQGGKIGDIQGKGRAWLGRGAHDWRKHALPGMIHMVGEGTHGKEGVLTVGEGMHGWRGLVWLKKGTHG